MEKELTWRYWINGVEFGDPTIQPGFYSFEDLVNIFTSEINGLEITVDRKMGKISMTIPEHHEILLPDRVKGLFGLDDTGRLSGSYEEDHAIEFSPQRIGIYLKQLSTTDNISNEGKERVSGSVLLSFIPLTNASFGEYFSTDFSKPSFKKLENSNFHELDFDFKIEFRNRAFKLDNHEQPIDLELEIK